MAFIYWDGFDNYSNDADWINAVGYDKISWTKYVYFSVTNDFLYHGGGKGRFGGRAMALVFDYAGPRIGSWKYALPSSKTEVWVGASIKLSDYNFDTQDIFSFKSSGGNEITIRYHDTNQVWQVIRGNSTVIYQLPNYTVKMGVVGSRNWHFIEARYVFGESAGIVEVWFDNQRIINLTNIDTVEYGNDAGITSIGLGGNNGAFYIDDLYILDTSGSAPDNTRIGDMRVYTLNMIADAGPNNGTPSTGNTHYQVVSDNNQNTYISIPNGTANSTMFNHSTVPITATSIVGLNILAYANKSDAGSALGHIKLVSNTASTNGESRSLLTNTLAYRESFTKNPDGNTSWTKFTIDNSKIGWEVE